MQPLVNTLYICSAKHSSSIPDQVWDHHNPETVSVIDLSQNQLTSVPDK